ncbi:MAG: hypothetical protein M3Q29_03550, partial [Chloroflexota bacterium]|nr:hypothetical protein [Chloroflexota bacterium]
SRTVWNWLNKNAGGVQALLALALVVLTGVYAVLTYNIAKANQEMVRASQDTVKEAARQRRGAVRPLIMFDLAEIQDDLSSDQTAQSAMEFHLTITNRGVGPAIHLSARSESQDKRDLYRLVGQTKPFVLEPGASATVDFSWHRPRPQRAVLQMTPEDELKVLQSKPRRMIPYTYWQRRWQEDVGL